MAPVLLSGSLLGTGGTAAAGTGALAGWATAATIASGVVGTIGAVAGAKAQNRAADYNAKSAEIEAQQMKEAGVKAEQQVRLKTANIIGQQRAVYGAAGVDPNAASAADVQAQTAAAGEEDALTTRLNYGRKAEALTLQSAAYRSSKVSPFMAGATTALSSIASSANSAYLKKLYGSGYGSSTGDNWLEPVNYGTPSLYPKKP